MELMQAPEPAKRSPWALRLTITGSVLILVGAVLMASQSSAISSSMDPRELHHGVYEGTGTFVTGELNDACYRFYQTQDDVEMTVRLHRVEGASLDDEPVREKKCLMDFQPMTADNTVMVERASWSLNTSGEYALVIECEANCTASQGWLMSINAMQNSIFGSSWLVLGFSLCCLGVFTTPIALIVYVASKPSQSPKVMMVGGDGQLIPITDLNPDHPTFFQQATTEEAMQQTVAPPFADTVEKQPSEQFIDGLPEVAAGTMLTTEQVYALMRGDVEGAQEHAKTQRYQTPTVEDTIVDAANAAAIASWDEGVPLAEPKPVERVAQNTPTAPQPPTSSSEAATNDWKDWDEQ